MKKSICTTSLLAVLAATLTGCAGPSITALDAEIETARSTARTSCHQARALADQARMQAIASMPEGQQAMAMMADAMARQSEALTGKDPCAVGMNSHEARARIAQSQNETALGVARPLITAAGAVGATYAVMDGVKALGKQAGDKIEAKEGSTISVEKTSSITDTRIDAQESTVSATGPDTHGTDKSTHETIHEAPAVEEPVAEEPAAEEPAAETPAAEE